MKIAFAGKGGVGKTTLCAWLGEYLALQGRDVWMVDADTALSLGVACGLDPMDLPEGLSRAEDLIRDRIGSGLMCLNPDLQGLPEALGVNLPLVGKPQGTCQPGKKRLLLMGKVEEGGEGCACGANALLKAFLAHMFFQDQQGDVLVDMEAGVEHLGRGTVEAADGLVVVSEASYRSLLTAAEVSRLACQLGLKNQVLVINRCPERDTTQVLDRLKEERLSKPALADLPKRILAMPLLAALKEREWEDGSVLFPCQMNSGEGNSADPAKAALAIEAVCKTLVLSLQEG